MPQNVSPAPHTFTIRMGMTPVPASGRGPRSWSRCRWRGRSPSPAPPRGRSGRAPSSCISRLEPRATAMSLSFVGHCLCFFKKFFFDDRISGGGTAKRKQKHAFCEGNIHEKKETKSPKHENRNKPSQAKPSQTERKPKHVPVSPASLAVGKKKTPLARALPAQFQMAAKHCILASHRVPYFMIILLILVPKSRTPRHTTIYPV